MRRSRPQPIEQASSSMGMLDGKVALVTGGSKGLGASTARLLAEASARVVVTFGNDADVAEKLIASLPGTGHRASHTPAQDTGAIESLAAAIGYPPRAGSTSWSTMPAADLRALDDDFFDFVLAVNLRGPFATVRACRGPGHRRDAPPKIRFAGDSPVEGSGLEPRFRMRLTPSTPPPGLRAKRERRVQRQRDQGEGSPE
jgi:NAD(P)-dependent dehydrogenase (short-subunit alcohol dehydrogenase family)